MWPGFAQKQARKLQNAQAEKLKSSKAKKIDNLTTLQAKD